MQRHDLSKLNICRSQFLQNDTELFRRHTSRDVIAEKKKHWIDFSAYGFDKDNKADELLSLIKEVADGKPTKNELCGNREIAIFKDGVTL